MQRDIAFLIFPEFQLLDLAGPLAAFQMAGTDLDAAPYRLRVLSATGGAIRSSVGVTVQSEPMTRPRVVRSPAAGPGRRKEDSLVARPGSSAASRRSISASIRCSSIDSAIAPYLRAPVGTSPYYPPRWVVYPIVLTLWLTLFGTGKNRLLNAFQQK